MNNRNNKSKRQSKLKHTVLQQRFGVNSPAKFTTTNALSSGCCPKQPPNISYHHLQKKRHEIKGQYYMLGKENKCRIMNNGVQQKEPVSMIDRFREKRNTHHVISYETSHSKLLQVKKPLINNYQSLSSQQTIKSLHKSKPLMRNPIKLGQFKGNKNKLLKQNDKQNKIQKNEKLIRRNEVQQRASYAPEAEQCHLKCFENLSSHSIAQSKVSTNYFGDINSLDESQLKVEQQRSIPNSKKRFQRSPQTLSPKIVIQVKKTPEQQILQFEKKINEINTNFEHMSLSYMQNKDLEFVRSKNINCYLGNQMFLDWKKRAMVINWMIDVLAQIGGKRETLANAVNIFDRYLSLTLNIPLDHIQCTAVSSLMIAGKLQDKSLSASYLSETTLNKYSTQQIMDEEYKIFQTLGFQVNNPTLNSWANRLAVQWDIYLDSVDLRRYDIILNNINNIKFKNSDQTVHIDLSQSYYNYRWLCQYIDFAIMDIYTLRYQPRMLSLAFIYLILVLRLNLTTKQKVINLYSNSSQFLFQKSVFHEFFTKFLRDSFGQELIDLLPMIQYCSTFVILPLRFGLPEVIPESNLDNQEQEVNYEHFCSYQTKNDQTLSSLYNRNRTIY